GEEEAASRRRVAMGRGSRAMHTPGGMPIFSRNSSRAAAGGCAHLKHLCTSATAGAGADLDQADTRSEPGEQLHSRRLLLLALRSGAEMTPDSRRARFR